MSQAIERVEAGEFYYVIYLGKNLDLTVRQHIEDNDQFDDKFYNSGNYNKSREALVNKLRIASHFCGLPVDESIISGVDGNGA